MRERTVTHDYLSDFLGDDTFARAADTDSPHLREPAWPWLAAGVAFVALFVLWLLLDLPVL